MDKRLILRFISEYYLPVTNTNALLSNKIKQKVSRISNERLIYISEHAVRLANGDLNQLMSEYFQSILEF